MITFGLTNGNRIVAIEDECGTVQIRVLDARSEVLYSDVFEHGPTAVAVLQFLGAARFRQIAKCEHCTGSFRAQRSSVRFCSARCRVAAWRKQA